MNKEQHDDIQKILEEFLPQNPKPLTSVDEFIKVEDHITKGRLQKRNKLLLLLLEFRSIHLLVQEAKERKRMMFTWYVNSGIHFEGQVWEWEAQSVSSTNPLFCSLVCWCFFLHRWRRSTMGDLSLVSSLYLLNERFCTRNVNGVKQKTFAGYSAVYNFFAYPQHTRKRISQFLVLPPFQKNQIGGELLNAIYRNSSTKDVKDIVVEDPSVEFR